MCYVSEKRYSYTEKQRYDGWFNNLAHPSWGAVGKSNPYSVRGEWWSQRGDARDQIVTLRLHELPPSPWQQLGSFCPYGRHEPVIYFANTLFTALVHASRAGRRVNMFWQASRLASDGESQRRRLSLPRIHSFITHLDWCTQPALRLHTNPSTGK